MAHALALPPRSQGGALALPPPLSASVVVAGGGGGPPADAGARWPRAGDEKRRHGNLPPLVGDGAGRRPESGVTASAAASAAAAVHAALERVEAASRPTSADEAARGRRRATPSPKPGARRRSARTGAKPLQRLAQPTMASAAAAAAGREKASALVARLAAAKLASGAASTAAATAAAGNATGEGDASDDASTSAAAKLRAAVNATAAISAMNRARDLTGKIHDASVMRTQRHKAMHKALTFMYKFLTKNGNRNLYTIGDDAPSIFFEMWYSTAESTIRTRAKEIAKVLFERLEARVCGATDASLKVSQEAAAAGSGGGSRHRKRSQASSRMAAKEPSPGASHEEHREDFFECLFMLRCKLEMGLDYQVLLHRADLCWKYGRLGEPDAHGGSEYGHRLYGTKRSKLHTVNTDDWLMLLMRILIVEYVNLLLNNRYVVRNYTLKEAFEVLRQGGMAKLCRIPATDAEHRTRSEEFRHSFYLATHIVFAHSAYSGIKTNNSDAPWLYRYLRKSLKFLLNMSKQKRKNPSVYVDCDGIGECVDCLRGLGLTEASDALLCSGTNWLLKYQKKDGSWPVWFMNTEGYDDEDTSDPYDILHPTWVCTQALRDRDFRVNEVPTRRWKAYIERVLKETRFDVLAYQPDW